MTLILCVLALCPSIAAWTSPIPVTANKTLVTPGQAVTLRWHFVGKKIVVSGGRFGKGAVVTKKTSVTDHPKKTTRYTFDVWYDAEAKSPKTGKVTKTPAHTRYAIVIEVTPGAASLLTYRASRGWQINYMRGWKADPVTTPVVGKNGLVFFQPEDDSIERLAVAMVPAKDLTTQELMQKVTVDIADKYADTEVVEQKEIVYNNAPALWVCFTGRSNANEGARTQSVILAFVHNDQAYFISARTAASRFKQRQSLLEAMVKSITLPAASVRAVHSNPGEI